MRISVTWGTGEGETDIAAFDSALWDAGVANYNIIRLSSVIPEGSDVVVEKVDMNNKDHGHRLYVVIAEAYQDVKGKDAVAGLGWVKANHSKGMFVERGADSRQSAMEYIEKTIRSIISYRLGVHGEIETKFAERRCDGKIACAVVIAVYKSEGWE